MSSFCKEQLGQVFQIQERNLLFQQLFRASLGVFSFKWMASPCTDTDIEGTSLIFAVVRQQGSRTNNTDTASTVTSSTSISGGTHSHLKAAFP